MRYRSEPKGEQIPLYRFGFSRDNLGELRQMKKHLTKVFLALVCVDDREICCLPYDDFERLVNLRRKAKGEDEQVYVAEVQVRQRERFRVGISPPNEKGQWLKSFVIPRSDFPRRLFL